MISLKVSRSIKPHKVKDCFVQIGLSEDKVTVNQYPIEDTLWKYLSLVTF